MPQITARRRLPAVLAALAPLAPLAPLALTPAAARAETAVSWRGVGELAGAYALDRPGTAGDRSGLYAAYALTGEVEHTTDSGLGLGVVATLGSGDYERSLTRPGTTEKATLNEAYLYLISAYGQLRLGDEDGAAKRAVDLLPLIGGGQMDGLWTGLAGSAPPVDHLGRDSDDATKILYETPRLLGLRAGVSYAPERQSLVEDIAAQSPVPEEEGFWELGLNYRADAGSWSYELAVGYGFADSGGPNLAETETLKLAGLAIYGGFALGAVWFTEEVGLTPGRATEQDGATLMGSYENGPYGLALWVQDAEVEGVRAWRAYGAGLSWRFSEVATLGLDLVRFDTDPAGPAPERTGTVAQLSVTAKF